MTAPLTRGRAGLIAAGVSLVMLSAGQTAADLTSPAVAITGGGLACILVLLLLALRWRGFARYDARSPQA